ncbi:putative F-box protein At1g47790 [Rutidosis leptorrhynchoides]|uniref:putative F-box protein At1g47790 n=1 Tax=Rutidosis leptorrhynchoides TaxID=125765 RepID=UPI003A997197
MSDLIPIDIQSEIIERVDVKSVLRFRSVSKSWKSLIDSPKFVASYGIDHIQRYVFLTSHLITAFSKYRSFVDDGDTLSSGQTVVPLLPKAPAEVHIIRIIGSSHGLICLECMYISDNGKHVGVYALWNPLIRKSVGIEVPPSCLFKVYFGVCPVTLDPKLVRITTGNKKWVVEIYTLSSGSWREISNNKLPRGTLEFHEDTGVVVTDKFIYWVAVDSAAVAAKRGNCLIVKFDLTSEEFKVIEIPKFVAPRELYDISKLNDSLVVLIYKVDSVTLRAACEVWMMDNVESQMIVKKLYNIEEPNLIPYGVRGFTKSGMPIIVTEEGEGDEDAWRPDGLYVYEPKSKRSTKITRLDRTELKFDVHNYHDTLLLLDR